MLDNKPNDADHLYYRTGFHSSDLIGLPVTESFTKAAIDRQVQELQDSIKASKQDKTQQEAEVDID